MAVNFFLIIIFKLIAELTLFFRDLLDLVGHLQPSVECSSWNFVLVHAHKILNELFRVVCEVSQVGTNQHAFIEILEIESLVRRSTVRPVAVSGSLEVFFGDLDLVPKSSQGLGHVRSAEFHLVNELAQEKLKTYFKNIVKLMKILAKPLRGYYFLHPCKG